MGQKPKQGETKMANARQATRVTRAGGRNGPFRKAKTAPKKVGGSKKTKKSKPGSKATSKKVP